MAKEASPTIEEQFQASVKVGDETVLLDVIDTAGQEEYSMLYEPYLSVADGLMVVFSLMDWKSLERAQQLIETNLNGAALPFIIVGNKLDVPKQQRLSSTEEITKQYGARYFEASALMGTNVTDVWEALIKKILTKQRASSISRPRAPSAGKLNADAIPPQANRPEPPVTKKTLRPISEEKEPKGDCARLCQIS